MFIPVILAGGSGTRLWPLSREAYPKQFISLIGENSLFQQTLERTLNCPQVQSPIIVTNEAHRFVIAEQLRLMDVSPQSIILEPSAKSTAAAVALAAMYALKQHSDDPVLLINPADHLIDDGEGFSKTVLLGLSAARSGKLVTFGITPGWPETGYGYIETDKEKGGVFQVKQFIEKPDLKQAQALIESPNVFWNSGIFMFRASDYLAELKKHRKDIYECMRECFNKGQKDVDFFRPEPNSFNDSPVDSVDYAVMEKTKKAKMVPLQSPWNDVGSWAQLADCSQKDAQGNHIQGDVVVEDVENCHIVAKSKLLAAVGVKDLIMVETPDAILVMSKSQSQQIKPVVEKLKQQSRKEVRFHQRVHRPWGAFDSIDNGERFQVKRISVAPNQRLSLQLHHHRSEHWVIVKGTARVTRGEEVFLLAENQSTYIPIGVKHCLENIGKIPLEIIEVQSGGYLGEDDIVRFEDAYGRLQDAPEKA